jgi:hypothetical protein
MSARPKRSNLDVRVFLVRNERATGRLKDLADLEAMGERPT